MEIDPQDSTFKYRCLPSASFDKVFLRKFSITRLKNQPPPISKRNVSISQRKELRCSFRPISSYKSPGVFLEKASALVKRAAWWRWPVALQTGPLDLHNPRRRREISYGNETKQNKRKRKKQGEALLLKATKVLNSIELWFYLWKWVNNNVRGHHWHHKH